MVQLVHTVTTFAIAGTSGTAAQQNYLTKTDLDSSVFLHENPVFMSVQDVVIPAKQTWMAPYFFVKIPSLCQTRLW